MFRKFLLIIISVGVLNAVISPKILQQSRDSATFELKIKVVEVEKKSDKRDDTIVTAYAKVLKVIRDKPKLKIKIKSSKGSKAKREEVKKGDKIKICYTSHKLGKKKVGPKEIPILSKRKYIAYLYFANECFRPSARSMSFKSAK